MIEFFVPGIPQPGGSKRGFPIRTGKFKLGRGGIPEEIIRVNIVDDASKGKDWKGQVAFFALKHFPQPFLDPMRLEILFVMPRPKNHFGTGKNMGNLKDSAAYWCETQPDATKLLRSTEDALKGIAWLDDKQVVSLKVEKVYGLKPGAIVKVIPLPRKAPEQP